MRFGFIFFLVHAVVWIQKLKVLSIFDKRLFPQFVIQGCWIARNTLLAFITLSVLEGTDFSSLAAFIALAALGRPFTEFGLPTVVPQFLAKRDNSKQLIEECLFIRILIGICTCSLIYFFSILLLPFDSCALNELQRIAILAGVVTDLSPLMMSIGQQLNKHRLVAIGIALATMSNFVLALFIVVFNCNLNGIVIILSAAGPLCTFFISTSLKYRPTLRLQEFYSHGINLVRNCFWQTIVDFFSTSTLPMVTYLTATLAPPQSVLIFRVAVQFGNFFITTAQSFLGAIRQNINRAVVENNCKKMRALFVRHACISLALSLSFALVAPIVSQIVFGQAKTDSTVFLLLAGYVFSASLLAQINLFTPGLLSKVEFLFWQIFGTVLSTLSVLWTVSHFQAQGAALCLSGGYVVVSIILSSRLLVSSFKSDGR